jgi:hypothetical protein
MVGGFNHNFRYKGEIYHVQTEDSGLRNPHVITLLYRGGTILASKKTSYADLPRTPNLEQVVESLMKEQHKEMLRRLRDGELDQLISSAAPAAPPSPPPVQPVTASPVVVAPVAVAPVVVAQVAVAPAVVPRLLAKPGPVPLPLPLAVVKTPPPAAEKPIAPMSRPPAAKQTRVLDSSLDEVILSYLVGDDKP